MNGVRGPTTRRERSGLARVRSQLTVLGDTFGRAAAASASVPRETLQDGGWSDLSTPLAGSGEVFFGEEEERKAGPTILCAGFVLPCAVPRLHHRPGPPTPRRAAAPCSSSPRPGRYPPDNNRLIRLEILNPTGVNFEVVKSQQTGKRAIFQNEHKTSGREGPAHFILKCVLHRRKNKSQKLWRIRRIENALTLKNFPTSWNSGNVSPGVFLRENPQTTTTYPRGSNYSLKCS